MNCPGLETRSVMLRSYSTLQYRKNTFTRFPSALDGFCRSQPAAGARTSWQKCPSARVEKCWKQNLARNWSNKREESKKPPCQHWWWWWPWWLDDECHRVSMLWSAGFLLTSRGGPPSIIIEAGTENYDNTVIMCTAASSSIHDVRSNVHLFELKHWTSLLDTLWLIT